MSTPNLPGGDLELAALGALWELGPASAREVHQRIGDPRGLVYTTTAKVLDRLHEKGLVSRRREGKAFVYRAAASREAIGKERARDVVRRLLGDEPRPAMAALIDAVETVDATLLDELGRLVAQKRERKENP
ncbi:BlaI/MecI/CopY family transcriptional regulator [Vulgatibacter incomptus]|uniref:Transcriptional regulator, MecI family n=1 Tax=Vulgatibacter incomptus TaxID=1391653 RepID=A0A0K1PJ68_9BACT|nr:BlaI/MecI/CopY family transcriptional regulator [Vulgatibacter incomptus]AKU93149.1 Transcriptional regulator, MecI family [Vulgatibacter incomptus]